MVEDKTGYSGSGKPPFREEPCSVPEHLSRVRYIPTPRIIYRNEGSEPIPQELNFEDKS